jgi:hypothetical protein
MKLVFAMKKSEEEESYLLNVLNSVLKESKW